MGVAEDGVADNVVAGVWASDNGYVQWGPRKIELMILTRMIVIVSDGCQGRWMLSQV